jgi:galactose oxidase
VYNINCCICLEYISKKTLVSLISQNLNLLTATHSVFLELTYEKLLTSALHIRHTSSLGPISCCLIVLVFIFHEHTYRFIASHIPIPRHAQIGSWSPIIPVPLVPAAAAVLPRTGGVVLWAADRGDTFGSEPGNPGRTLTAFYNLATNEVSSYNMTVTNHNMFCPGISLNSVGTLVVTVGSSSEHTSFYSSLHGGSWIEGPKMVIGRGYHSQATLSDR